MSQQFAPFCQECGSRLPTLRAHAVACPSCGGDLLRESATTAEPWIAAGLSFVLPGAGQIYNGHFGRGLLVFLTCWLVVPWIFGVIDAWRSAKRGLAAARPVYL